MNYRIELGSFGLLEGNGEIIECLLLAVVDREKIQGRTCEKLKGRVQKGDAAEKVEKQLEDRRLEWDREERS